MRTLVRRQEDKLKGQLFGGIRKALPSFVLLTHQDVRSSGIPDGSLTGHQLTTWLECKHGTPHFDGNGIQELTMLRLAVEGCARYVIWQENADGTGKRTLIVHPNHLRDLLTDDWCDGFDHQFVIGWLRRMHLGGGR